MRSDDLHAQLKVMSGGSLVMSPKAIPHKKCANFR